MFTRDTCVTPSTSALSPGFCLACVPTQACGGSFPGRRPRAAEKTKLISHRFRNQTHLVLTSDVIVYQRDLEWVPFSLSVSHLYHGKSAPQMRDLVPDHSVLQILPSPKYHGVPPGIQPQPSGALTHTHPIPWLTSSGCLGPGGSKHRGLGPGPVSTSASRELPCDLS